MSKSGKLMDAFMLKMDEGEFQEAFRPERGKVTRLSEGQSRKGSVTRLKEGEKKKGKLTKLKDGRKEGKLTKIKTEGKPATLMDMFTRPVEDIGSAFEKDYPAPKKGKLTKIKTEGKPATLMDMLSMPVDDPASAFEGMLPERENYVTRDGKNPTPRGKLTMLKEGKLPEAEKKAASSPTKPASIMPKIGEQEGPSRAPAEPSPQAIEQMTKQETPESQEESWLEAGWNSIKKAYDDSPNFWVGAAPLLMGALVGDVAAGAAAGAQGLQQRYQDERDEGIAALKALKSSEKKLQKFKYQDAEGNMRMGSFDPATGNKYDAEGQINNMLTPELSYEQKRGVQDESWVRRGMYNVIKVNPVTGLVERIDRRTGRATTLFDTAGLNPVQKKDAVATASDYNKIANPVITQIRDLEQGFEDLVVNNQLSNKLAVMRFIKEVETRLSDYDRLYYTQEISDMAKARERMRKVRGNSVNPRLLNDAMGLVSRAMGKSKRRLGDARNMYSSQLRGRDFPSDKIDQIFGDAPKFLNIQGGKVKMQGEGGTFMVPVNELGDAINRGYSLKRE